MENNELEQVINLYSYLMELFKYDKNNYTILLDYQNNTLTFDMKNKKDFKITKFVNCDKYSAEKTIDLIRNNFIINHDITLPLRGMQTIKLPDINFYSYIMCHHLKNNKFDLIVTIRTKDDEKRMDEAQNKIFMKKKN